MSDDFVRIYDSTLSLVKELTDFDSALFTERAETIGEFQLVTRGEETYDNCFVRFGRRPELSGKIEYRSCEEGVTTYKGYSCLGLLYDRFCVPTKAMADGYYHYKGECAEDILYDLVDKNAVNPEDEDRKIPLLTCAQSQHRGGKMTKDIRFDRLTDAIQAICEESGLSVRVNLLADSKKLQFEVFEGVDRTQLDDDRYLIEERFDRVSSTSFEWSALATANYAIVLGQGDGAERTRVDVDKTNGAPRREVVVDARDVPDEQTDEDGNVDKTYDVKASLEARGIEKLNELRETASREFVAATDEYNLRYSVGDTLMYRDSEITQVGKVTEAMHAWEGGEYTVSVTVGHALTTILSAIQTAANDAVVERTGIDGKFRNLTAQLAEVETLVAGKVDADWVDAWYVTAVKGEFDEINAKVLVLDGQVVDATALAQSAKDKADTLEAQKADITDLTAQTARITDLETDNTNVKGRLTAAEADITDLTANKADVTDLTAATGRITNLESTKASITDLTAQTGRIDTLFTDLTTANTLIAQKATITDLDAATGRIALLESGKADIGDLTAVSTRTGTLEAGVANINLLLSGSTVSGSTQTIVLNAQNCTVDTAFFENLISSYVTAGYIFGDTISTNDFTIKSDDGGLEMADKTIQIKDSTRVRIQIGEDSSGDYNLYLWDEDGNLLWDAQGLTATGISRPIIKDSMVADNAGIAGSKLNIPSVVQSINNGTTKIESALVNVDGQSLNVAFNTLETKVDDMEVGGRNLILDSKAISNSTYYTRQTQWTRSTNDEGFTVLSYDADNDTETGANRDVYFDCVTLPSGVKAGEVYTYSFYARGSGQITCYFYKGNGDQNFVCKTESSTGVLNNYSVPTSDGNCNITLTDDWKRYWVRWTVGQDGSKAGLILARASTSFTTEAQIYAPKLEKGTFATDWTPAPEDVEDKITTQSTQISVIQGQISSLITNVEQLNENKADGSQVTTLTNNYNSLKQTVDGTVNDIGSLQTTIATKADSSTVTTISDRQNTLSNTVNGLTQRIQSAETTLESKADNSTVTTIQNNYNTLSNTVNGLESSVGTVTTTVNGTIASSITLFYSSDSTSVPALPTSKVTSTSTGSKTWTTVVPTFSASYPYLYTCMQQTTVAGNVTWTKAVSGSYANYVSGVNTTANAGIKETVTLFYASANASAPSKPTSAVTTSSATTYGAWNKTLPTYSASYPYLYLCTQTLTNGGTYAWTNVESGSYADYISSLSSEQASLKTTVNSITSKVSNLTSAVGANADGSLTTSLTDQISEVRQTASGITSSVSSLQAQVDGIQVGARNLLLKSKTLDSAYYERVENWTKSTDDAGFTVLSYDKSLDSGTGARDALAKNNAINTTIKEGDVYIYSFWARGTGQIRCYFYKGSTGSNNFVSKVEGSTGYKSTSDTATSDGTCCFTLTNDWKRYWVRWTVGQDSTGCTITLARASTSFTTEAQVYAPKLEKGNKPTDWTPAPEDIESSITAVQEYASSIDQKADSITSTVSSVQNQLEDTESDISGLATRVSTAEQKITPDAITLAVNETVSNGTRSLTNGSSFTLTNDTCTIDGAKLIIRGSGKSLEESLDITASGRNLVVDGEFSKTKTNTNLTKGSGVFPASWDYCNPGLPNYQNIYTVYIDQETFGFNVAAFNESDGTRHWKALAKSIVSGWGFDGTWGHYRLSIDVYATGAGTKLTGGFYYARPEDNGTGNFRSGQFSIPSSKISVGEWSRVSVEIPYNHDWDGTSVVTFYLYGHNFSADEILYVKNISINNATCTCDFTRNTNEIQSDIEVGGRNYLRKSQDERIATFPESGYQDLSWTVSSSGYKISETINAVAGDTYTLSFDAKADNAGAIIWSYFHNPLVSKTGVTSQGSKNTATDGRVTFTLSTEYKRYWVVWTFNEDGTANSLIPCRALYSNGSGKVYLKNVKLEKGNKPTDWTPAPEDVEANIDDAKSMADDAQDTASTALSTASNALTEALTSLDRLDELDPLVRQTVEDASKALANLKTWTKDGTQTMIDGGKIYTGTITADKIYGENLAAIRATLGDVKAGSISSPNGHIKINLYNDNAGIQITNSVLETTLHIDANGTWVTNAGGTTIAQFTSSGTETVDLTATGTSLLSGLKIEKQSTEVWISYGG